MYIYIYIVVSLTSHTPSKSMQTSGCTANSDIESMDGGEVSMLRSPSVTFNSDNDSVDGVEFTILRSSSKGTFHLDGSIDEGEYAVFIEDIEDNVSTGSNERTISEDNGSTGSNECTNEDNVSTGSNDCTVLEDNVITASGDVIDCFNPKDFELNTPAILSKKRRRSKVTVMARINE